MFRANDGLFALSKLTLAGLPFAFAQLSSPASSRRQTLKLYSRWKPINGKGDGDNAAGLGPLSRRGNSHPAAILQEACGSMRRMLDNSALRDRGLKSLSVLSQPYEPTVRVLCRGLDLCCEKNVNAHTGLNSEEKNMFCTGLLGFWLFYF